MLIEGFLQRYLERIGLDPKADYPPSAQTLATLQEAHVKSVPFEIIDTMLGAPIDLAPEALFEKIVTHRRGGFCYELNGLFAILLEDLGFDVTRLAALVPSCGNRFDHIFLEVRIDGERWLSDVGFRQGPLVPIRIEQDLVQDGIKAQYRFVAADPDELAGAGFKGASLWLERRDAIKGSWTRLFVFDNTSFSLGDYASRCHYFATTQDCPFKRRPSCSVELREGEVYLNDAALVDFADKLPTRQNITTASNFAQTLIRRFDVLPGENPTLQVPSASEEPLDVCEVVALEQEIDAAGTPLRELMERAGCAVADAVAGLLDIQRVAPWGPANTPKAIILAGTGNNGGDGWVAARRLHEAGYDVTLVARRAAQDIKAQPARDAANALPEQVNLRISPNADELEALLANAGVVVDAILGTGFSATDVREPYATWIKLANAAHKSGVPVLAVDCPSGLSAQTGMPSACCIEADITVTMLRSKKGLSALSAEPFVGKLRLARLV